MAYFLQIYDTSPFLPSVGAIENILSTGYFVSVRRYTELLDTENSNLRFNIL
jgi:hypothetical protein